MIDKTWKIFDQNPFVEVPQKKISRNNYSWHEEIPDYETGYIHARISRGRKGRKLRKLFTNIGSYNDEFFIWEPILNDLAKCEARRWKAVTRYQNFLKEYNKVFKQLSNQSEFCAIRDYPKAPYVKWVLFRDSHYDHGISWSWQDNRPDCPINQELGNSWFQVDTKNKTMISRVARFEQVFLKSLHIKYKSEIEKQYRNDSPCGIESIINGRRYILGFNQNSYSFGIIFGPEKLITDVVN